MFYSEFPGEGFPGTFVSHNPRLITQHFDRKTSAKAKKPSYYYKMFKPDRVSPVQHQVHIYSEGILVHQLIHRTEQTRSLNNNQSINQTINQSTNLPTKSVFEPKFGTLRLYIFSKYKNKYRTRSYYHKLKNS